MVRRTMVRKACVAAAVASAGLLVVAGPVPALARAPAPLVPTALVEDVRSATAGIEFMDYVGSGQVIRLAPGDTLVLGYLKSCEHETITGGTIKIGPERSEVDGGQVIRARVPCDGGKVRLTAQQAGQSGASAFRLQSADIRPVLYGRSPLVQLPADLAADDRTLVIARADTKRLNGKPGPAPRLEVRLDDTAVRGGFYDLAASKARLDRGAVYTATLGARTVTFKIDAKAASGATTAVSRLLRFP